uniref:Uncharacterized protein n=1 Tax=Rhizophora mucronata TaxID=61149 RepID=A0A2P2NHK2_RHIMU
MNKEGPDYFTYYIREVERLLSEDDNFLPFASELAGDKCEMFEGKETVKHHNTSSGSPFSDSAGSGLSHYKRERLVSLLQQALTALTPEVDEMLEPVVAMQNLRSQVRSKTLVSEHRGSASENNVQQVAYKKSEMTSFSSSTGTTALASPVSSISCS